MLGSTITVHNSEHDLTCTIGSGSPSTSGFTVGNAVRMYCLNGALYSLTHTDAPPTTTETTTTTATTTTASGDAASATGAISALSTSSITVHDGDRDLTCTIGSSSPSVSGFAVGNGVRMYCLNGALYAISHCNASLTTCEGRMPGTNPGFCRGSSEWLFRAGCCRACAAGAARAS